MMAELVANIVEQVKLELDDNSVKDNVIKHYVEKSIKLASHITNFDNMPTEFAPYIVDVVVEALNRRTNEGVSNKSALGVSTTFVYNDIEKSLKAKLKGKRNPRSLVGQHGSNQR